MRRGAKQIFCRYDFRFTQAGKPVYESDQAAMWLLVDGDTAIPETSE
jgi:hypothetical protein